jgi:hypothetical protein
MLLLLLSITSQMEVKIWVLENCLLFVFFAENGKFSSYFLGFGDEMCSVCMPF